jgi:hypothetical protein
MSSITGQDSGTKAEDCFAAISKQLAAMDDYLRSMEGRFHTVDTIQAKVTTLEESTGVLGAQQDMLSSTVEGIDLAQIQLAADTSSGASAPRDPTHGRPQHANRHRHGDDDDDAGDEIVPMMHKLEFRSMTAPVTRYHGLIDTSGTSTSAARQSRSASRWPLVTFWITHSCGSIRWNSTGAAPPRHSSHR